MAGIEHLTLHIYHEKQERGSALCAQHALNSLLQGSYFTPTDLSTIAQSLDSLEQDVDQGRLGRESANMDDTGFFSIQVLENALNVWGQSLMRWRSEAMRPHNNRPQDQRAFILNCDQHWFTLRKFGDPDGVGPWFNLNSSIDRPDWVSETYLGILLQQAEADGYSVFVVVPIDPDHPLPQADADVFAAALSPPASSRSQHSSTAHSSESSVVLEDEDFQLQAALHASLDDGGTSPPFPEPSAYVERTIGGAGVLPPNVPMGIPSPYLPASPPPPIPAPGTRPEGQPMTNPVAASMARNQVVLERMRREQEAALREHYREEVSRFDDRLDGSFGLRGHAEDEEEQLKRAIAESEEMARGQGSSGSDAEIGTRDGPDNTQAGAWVQGRIHGGRVYDDEDAELQAALQASLETAPPEVHTPNANTTRPRAAPARRSPFTAAPAAGPRAGSSTRTDEDEDDDDDEDEDDELYFNEDEVRDTATEETLSEAADPPQAEDPDLDEMRRRRLARFGG
ncbi:Josephin-domain-containing protein [Russula earlei]|uniref:Josephin-domain-containing protein n=1 Tax=Russula earlei TaxID=71964 RepID=A0ACC0U1Z1_9AGAM|nr:Josephin-domain-containing protein [Russula earlei]